MIQTYTISFRAMGSAFNVWLETAADGVTVLQKVPSWVEAIEEALSRFRPASELSRLNARSGKWVSVSDTLLQAVIHACRAADLTGGLCNPLLLPALLAAGYRENFADLERNQHAEPDIHQSSPWTLDWRRVEVRPKQRAIRLPAGGQLDLGGTAKGWTAAQIARRLSTYGPCLVDAGGDLVARGKPHQEDGWQINVAEPAATDPQPPLAMVRLANAAIATSGTDYRLWRVNGKPQHHLIDPRTGQPVVTDVLSATVIHTDAVLAEAFAKALIVLGSQAGLEWLLRQPQKSALVVRRDGAILATSDFQSKMSVPALIL